MKEQMRAVQERLKEELRAGQELKKKCWPRWKPVKKWWIPR
jgi:hypothetical protein